MYLLQEGVLSVTFPQSVGEAGGRKAYTLDKYGDSVGQAGILLGQPCL